MKAKRFLGVLLAMLMVVLCFAVSASADVVSRPATGNLHIVLKDAEPGTAGNGTQQSVDGNGVSGVVFGVLKVADDAKSTATSEPNSAFATQTTDDNGEATFENLQAGRYLVKVISKPESTGNINNFLVDVPMTNPDGQDSWMEDVYVYPKISVIFDEPVIEKFVKSDSNAVYSKGSISVAGDETVTWKISVTVPASINLYNTFVVTDTVSDKLTMPADVAAISVKSAGTDLADEAVTKAISDKTMTLTFAVDKLTAGQIIDIEYVAPIANPEADSAVVIPNKATVAYTHQPVTVTDDETGETSTKDSGSQDSNEPSVYTGKLEVEKIVSGSAETLKGATFELFKTNTDGVLSDTLGTATTGTETYQKAIWTGLKDGTYFVKEVVAPTGYELNDTIYRVTVENGVGTLEAVTDNKVPDIAKPNLPLTGGMGVTLFFGLGLALAACAGVYLVKSRKVEE